MSLNRIKKLLNEDISLDEINIKKALSEEYLAISDYEKFAMQSKDERVRKVLLDIKDEEEAHVAELLELLKILGINDNKAIEQGTKEVKDSIE